MARAASARPLPGDRIFIHILREPLLSDTVTVDEGGRAAFPKIGLIDVASMSIATLTDSLRTRYGEYLRTPELEIVVLRRIIVNGEVMKPGVYLVDVSSTVADMIARAGGFTEAARRGSVRLVRDGSATSIAFNDTRGIGTDLKSGDEIVVGRRPWILMNILPAVSTVALIASIIIANR